MRTRHTLLVALATVFTALVAVLTPAGAAADEAGTQAANELYIQNRDGRWEHFWVHDTNRQLYHRWELTPGGSRDWSGSASLGGTLLYDQIDGDMNTDGRLEIFGVGTNRAMFHIWQLTPGGGWSGWASLGGGFNGPPTTALTSYGGIIVYAYGLDNLRYRRHQTAPSCCWSSGWVRG